MEDQASQELQKQTEEAQALDNLKQLPGFDAYADLMIKTVADKMLWGFSTGKSGDNIQNWDDFCKLKGEVVARLQPIQDVYGAKHMIDYLRKQLQDYYKEQ